MGEKDLVKKRVEILKKVRKPAPSIETEESGSKTKEEIKSEHSS